MLYSRAETNIRFVRMFARVTQVFEYLESIRIFEYSDIFYFKFSYLFQPYYIVT